MDVTVTNSTALTMPRSGATLAAVQLESGPELWLVGGQTNNGVSDQILRWHDELQEWLTVPVIIPKPFYHGACVAYNKSLMCFGGYDADGKITNNRVLVRNNTAYSDTAYVAIAQYGAAMYPMRNWWIVAGGQTQILDYCGRSSSTASVDLYEQSWRTMQPYPEDVIGLFCSPVGPSFLCCGGEFEDGSISKNCFEFNGTWFPVEPLPQPRAFGCANYLATIDAFCLFGGVSTNNELVGDVFCRRSVGGGWVQAARSIQPRKHLSCQVYGDTVHIVGGTTTPGKISATHEIFAPTIIDCTQATLYGGTPCRVPPAYLSPSDPTAQQPFLLTLPPVFYSFANATVTLTSDPRCQHTIAGPTKLVASQTGQPFVTFTVYQPQQRVYVCVFNAAGNHVIVSTSTQTSLTVNSAGFSFTINHYLAYRVEPLQPIQKEEFEVFVVGEKVAGRLLITRGGCPDPTDTQAELERIGNGQPLRHSAVRSTPSIVLSMPEVSTELTVCLQREGDTDWAQLPPVSIPLSIAPRHSWVEVMAAGTFALVALSGLTSLGNGLPIISDYHVTAILSGVGCAAVELRSYHTVAQWMVAPMAWFRVSFEQRLNNFVGVIIVGVLLLAIDLLLGRRPPPFLKQRTIRVPLLSLIWALITLPGLLIFGRTKYGLEGTTAFGAILDVLAVLLGCGLLFVIFRRLRFSDRHVAEFVPITESVVPWSVLPLPTSRWRSMQPGFVRRWGIVFADYKPSNLRFGIVSIARVLLIGLIVGLPLDCGPRAVACALVLLLFLGVLVWRRPARDVTTNVLRSLATIFHMLLSLSLALTGMHPMIPAFLAMSNAVLTLDAFWCFRRVFHEFRNGQGSDFVQLEPM
eukprot:TRINITY_DN69726_c0_g1_i1.p1 TRINITY_DN69726_c0_g1~~TRINITY_DN69726_c0_g1_i1.p1  ORF type:complete len:876 (+),score=99.93 TRINITY_DN69726_c0_g1_i1:56-2629(+)